MPVKIRCDDCGKTRAHYARGKCQRCYKNALKRAAWARMPPKTKAKRLKRMREAARVRRKAYAKTRTRKSGEST